MNRTAALIALAALAVGMLAGCSSTDGAASPSSTLSVTTSPTAAPTASTVPPPPSTTTSSVSSSATTNPATGHPLKALGETLTITPVGQPGDGPATAKVIVKKISRGKKGIYGATVRINVSVSTGTDKEVNQAAKDFLCGAGSIRSIDPDSGEELHAQGGYMVSANPPATLGTSHAYECTFDAESLHDHGWLVLGPYELKIDYPYDLR